MDSLAYARQDLRQRQAQWGFLARAVVVENPVAAALSRAAAREANSRPDGSYLLDDVFRYPDDSERARWALTRQIIERVAPGPFEDPVFLEMLARQAASIEIALCPEGGTISPEALSRIIVGTIGQPRSEAYSAAIGDAAVIAVSAGMMEFIYQCAKVVVLSWKKRAPAGPGQVSFSVRPEDTAEVLGSDPYPVALLRSTLAAWLFKGRPRSAGSRLPSSAERIPVTRLINGAERFVLAHEYGHALMHELKVLSSATPAPPENESAWDKEFAADTFGALAVSESSRLLDLLPANIALMGAELVMKAHEIFDQVFGLVRGGEMPDESVASHPPFAQRAAVLEQLYLQLHPEPTIAREDLEGMRAPAETLDQIWARVAPELVGTLRAGMPLDPVWSPE
jgi:hypothetical protein